jgi:hypothetical protein
MRSQRLSLVAALALVCAQVGCAMNVSEVRSARVLRGGEIQVSEVNNIVLPSRAIENSLEPAKSAASAAGSRELTAEERRALVGAATSVALTGPGYGVHSDVAVGLGYRYDAQLRVGNGIYGLSLRRGFDLGRRYHAALGMRGAYNSGSMFVEYVGEVTDVVQVSKIHRFDGQLFAQLGAEFGEWGKLWLGAKGMVSPLAARIDARSVGVGTDKLNTTLWHYGGFVGGAIGYRWLYLVGEVTVLGASGSVKAFGDRYDMSGVVVAPSWGLMGVF